LHRGEVIPFFPTLSETIVLSITAEEVVERIGTGIEAQQLFGSAQRDEFQLTAKTLRPTQFQPLMKGAIEESSRGCIILLTYHLLLSTRLYLSFWGVIVMLASIAIGWNTRSLIYTGVGPVLILIIGLIVRSNLKLQSEMARQVLLDQLS
jgi:hypothetical protein